VPSGVLMATEDFRIVRIVNKAKKGDERSFQKYPKAVLLW
jgi:hypothetical protein